MEEKDLRERFLMALSKIKGWEYSDTVKKENSVEVKAIVEKFIFQELPEQDKNAIIRKIKTSRMSMPPSITAVKNNAAAQQQIISVMALMEASDNWDEFEELAEKRSSKKEQPEPEEPLNDFDKILIGIMAVPKTELDKNKKDGSSTEI